MIMRNIFSFIGFVVFTILLFSCKKGNTSAQQPDALPVTPVTNIAVPLAGNGYITQPVAGSSEEITDNGLGSWTSTGSVTSVYFRLGQTGQLHIAVKAKTPTGNSVVKVFVKGTEFTLKLNSSDYKSYFAGTVNISEAGYVKVDLQGVSKTGNYFANVSDILIGGSATTANVVFANDPQNFYWSRRGPSCHLGYTTPAEDKEFFYSELTVPADEDKIGSYFMANGFGEGYFGIQVISATERRVLFSVWDPTTGQTTLVRKGTDVTAGRFGGEGTGGQSYMNFDWKAGTTYKFLTQGKPDGANNTVYTSWFFAPETGDWKLIASWTRPNTNTYLTHFNGFLENFNPEQGYQTRKAFWGNQWVRMVNGNWSEVKEFKFTVDATGTNKQRLDYAGGVENGKFFLQNGGFFANTVTPGGIFKKAATGQQPSIDIENLP